MLSRRALYFGILLCELFLGGSFQQDAQSKRNVLNTLDLKVFEESGTNAELLDLSKHYKFSKNRPLPEVSLVSANPDWTRLLRFDRQSQKLFAIDRLDREELCFPTAERCFIQVDLHIDGHEVLRLNLEIVDINDQSPEFGEKNYEVHVSELSQPGVIFQFPPAVDKDGGRNAELTFSIHPTSPPFQIEVQRNSLNKVVDLRLVLTGELDRETKSSYRLVVTAEDSGTPPRTGSTTINIYVDDENDNQPVFEQSQYSAELGPDNPVGYSVLTVKATDKDEGPHARIKYYFAKKTASIYGRLFSIDKTTGEIKLISKVANHRHLPSPYQLVIFAENFGLNEIPTSTNVVIYVVNANNHAPAITVESRHRGSNPENLIIEENNVADFVLAQIMAHDSDPGEGGLVDCGVEDVKSFYMTRLDANAFQLIVREPLDREKEGLHKINIQCEDMGNPPLSTSLQINLIVTDVDDNPPRFSKHSYSASIRENNPVGVSILTLEIEDLDTDPENSRSDFFIEPHFEHLFGIDHESGTLVTLVSFDREQSDFYSFHVFAKGGKLSGDNSSYRHVAKTLVNLTVLDVDDELPRFEQPWFKFDLTENMAPGFVVGWVKAFDPDLPPNNIFQYSLFPPSPLNLNIVESRSDQKMKAKASELPFDIEPLSGAIFTKVPIDRELQSRYEFNVYVGNDSSSVFIDIIDVNDNPPQWVYPKSDSCQNGESLPLQGNLTFAQHLTTILATDKDIDKHGEVTYRIVSGNEFGQFSLESKTGKISWNSYLSGLKQHNQCRAKMTFVAQDSGEQPLVSKPSCLEVVFEECLAHLEMHQQKALEQPKEALEDNNNNNNNSNNKGHFSELYIIIIVVVLVICIIISIVLTAVICVTRQQTKDLKRNKYAPGDLRASLPLTGPDNEAVLVLDRSSTNESSDQLTGILVSLRSAEQLSRLQLRNLAPSKDSLMSTSISLHRERDADSGYADVSPV